MGTARKSAAASAGALAESAGAQAPAFQILRGLLLPFTIDGGTGDDKLVVDLTYGNPLPDGGLDFVGGVELECLSGFRTSGAGREHTDLP